VSDSIVRAYSESARGYDDDGNLRSCWGRVADRARAGLRVASRHRAVVEVGCGTGRDLAELARRSAGASFIGIEPAAGMRERALATACGARNVRVVDGRFEDLPLGDGPVDYLFSILAFHWTTDVERSVDELARVLRPDGEMDLFFTGRDTGREFTARMTPIFLTYLGPVALLESARRRRHLTRDTATELFRRRFPAERLSVEESFETFHDDLDGHWSWWVSRAAGHFDGIPQGQRAACDGEIRAAISGLAVDGRIPYTVHLLHVRLRS
jgi:ubiquinone/menaquinone biosynthesis C-methylase UbiE